MPGFGGIKYSLLSFYRSSLLRNHKLLHNMRVKRGGLKTIERSSLVLSLVKFKVSPVKTHYFYLVVSLHGQEVRS